MQPKDGFAIDQFGVAESSGQDFEVADQDRCALFAEAGQGAGL